MHPEMALDFSEVSGEHCLNTWKAGGAQMVHFAVDPSTTSEDVVEFVRPIRSPASTSISRPCPGCQRSSARWSSGNWYYLPAGEAEPHHGTTLSFPCCSGRATCSSAVRLPDLPACRYPDAQPLAGCAAQAVLQDARDIWGLQKPPDLPFVKARMARCDAMGEGQELLRIWWRRIWRRRWLCLGVTSATCALGWTGVGLLTMQKGAGAGLPLALVLLAGAAVGAGAAALVAVRSPVFDSIAELQRAFRTPVLGSVADLTPASSRRATLHIPFALACLALIGAFAGLVMARALG
jgi:hypothetical protein